MSNTKTKGLNRRDAIGSVVAAGMLSAPASAAGQSLKLEQSNKTFVLVHGAWHGGWCWRDVRVRLEAKGHRVFTPTLTGLAERKHLLSSSVGLDTHIEDVTAMIDYYDLNEIILVGHSYGGMVITGIADALKDRIERIIYLDAALPQAGQNMISQGPPRDAATLQATEQALRALVPDGGLAMQAFPPDILGIPKGHPNYHWVAEKLTPHPLKTWLDPIILKNGGSEGLKRSYIHCINPVLPNSSFPWHAAQVRKDPSWQYHALLTGHDAMITAPEELVATFEKCIAA